MLHKRTLTQLVRDKARELGFEGCGFSKAQVLDIEARRLEEWLRMGYHGQMDWMENYFDKRIDPTALVEGAKSVISLFMSYHFEENEEIDHKQNHPKVAKYARGRDYHKVIRKKLQKIIDHVRDEVGEVHARAFVDSAPVMDKAWAVRSGLGWMGKNGNLLTKRHGSWILLGEIILDIEFDYDGPTTDHCGSCTRCIDACPTDAIIQPSVIDAKKCISYLTIELEESIPNAFRDSLEGWAFGCDICQDVCPWNRKSAYGQTKDFIPKAVFSSQSFSYWETLSKNEFIETFRGTPLMRSGYEKMKENVSFARESMPLNRDSRASLL